MSCSNFQKSWRTVALVPRRFHSSQMFCYSQTHLPACCIGQPIHHPVCGTTWWSHHRYPVCALAQSTSWPWSAGNVATPCACGRLWFSLLPAWTANAPCAPFASSCTHCLQLRLEGVHPGSIAMQKAMQHFAEQFHTEVANILNKDAQSLVHDGFKGGLRRLRRWLYGIHEIPLRDQRRHLPNTSFETKKWLEGKFNLQGKVKNFPLNPFFPSKSYLHGGYWQGKGKTIRSKYPGYFWGKVKVIFKWKFLHFQGKIFPFSRENRRQNLDLYVHFPKYIYTHIYIHIQLWDGGNSTACMHACMHAESLGCPSTGKLQGWVWVVRG